jgi:YVTN family beta-propeller protein
LCVSDRSATADPFIYIVTGALDPNSLSIVDAVTNTAIDTIPVECAPMGSLKS